MSFLLRCSGRVCPVRIGTSRGMANGDLVRCRGLFRPICQVQCSVLGLGRSNGLVGVPLFLTSGAGRLLGSGD